MRTRHLLSLPAFLALALLGCRDDSSDAREPSTDARVGAPSPTQEPLPSGHPPIEPDPVATLATGTVLEKADAEQYTYVRVDVGDRHDWFAAPAFAIEVGDTVELPTQALPMRNFESQALGRTFELVYFVQALRKAGAEEVAATVAKAHAAVPAAPETPAAEFRDIERPEGGKTVAEVFAAGAAAAGQEILLRGKVVKFTPGVLGKNWLHVRDGTGSEGTNDLVVTTTDNASVGDTVLIRGKLAADRDLGYGYRFALLVEEAVIVVE